MPASGSEYFFKLARCLWQRCCMTQPNRNGGSATAALAFASAVRLVKRSEFCNTAATPHTLAHALASSKFLTRDKGKVCRAGTLLLTYPNPRPRSPH